MSLCIVTAFLDISRGDWQAFQRSTRKYIDNFLFYRKLNHEIIVFMDDKCTEELKTLTVSWDKLTVIPINREWMKENIYAYKSLQREQEIMDSPKFKEMVKHRLHHPECCKAEYNIIQHSKIDFVCYAIREKLSTADYYAWSDFGYFQHPGLVPQSDLDLNKFDLERINFIGVNPIRREDFNIMYTLTQAPSRIEGGFCLGHKDKLLEYQELYHVVCQFFHSNDIVDDDQHIIIQCYLRSPSKFRFLVTSAMSSTFLFFQKNSELLNCGTILTKIR